MFVFSHYDSRIKCEIYSKLTIEATDVVLVPSLLTFNIADMFLVIFVEIEHINAGWNTSLP